MVIRYFIFEIIIDNILKSRDLFRGVALDIYLSPILDKYTLIYKIYIICLKYCSIDKERSAGKQRNSNNKAGITLKRIQITVSKSFTPFYFATMHLIRSDNLLTSGIWLKFNVRSYMWEIMKFMLARSLTHSFMRKEKHSNKIEQEIPIYIIRLENKHIKNC